MIDFFTVLLLAIKCPAPKAGNNTKKVPTTPLTYLQIYNYTCLEGYNTTDTLYTVCQYNGMLSLTVPPNCVGK